MAELDWAVSQYRRLRADADLDNASRANLDCIRAADDLLEVIEHALDN